MKNLLLRTLIAIPAVAGVMGANAVDAGAAVVPGPVPIAAKFQAEIAAQQQRERRLEHSPAVKVLNPYYIRIATAVVTHDEKALARYATVMRKFAADRSRPYLRFPATRAEVFCLARLHGKGSFIHAFAGFCRMGRTTLRAPRAIAFTQAVFGWLKTHKKASWIDAAVAAGLPACGPGPGKLFIYLFNLRLADMKNPLAKAKAIREAIVSAGKALARSRKFSQGQTGKDKAPNDPLVLGYPPRLEQYRKGLETLHYELVLNAANGLSTGQLCRAARMYLHKYGAHGRYSSRVFYQTLNSLYQVHRVVTDSTVKRLTLEQGRWLGAWYPKIIDNKNPLDAAIKSLWQKWVSSGG